MNLCSGRQQNRACSDEARQPFSQKRGLAERRLTSGQQPTFPRPQRGTNPKIASHISSGKDGHAEPPSRSLAATKTTVATHARRGGEQSWCVDKLQHCNLNTRNLACGEWGSTRASFGQFLKKCSGFAQISGWATTYVSRGQLINAALRGTPEPRKPGRWSDGGKTTTINHSHPTKALLPTTLTASGMVIAVRLLHAANANGLMVLSPRASEMFERAVQPLKAPKSIPLTLLCMSTVSRVSLPRNKPRWIQVTCIGMLAYRCPRSGM